MPFDPVKAFRLTVTECGDAPDQQLATAIEQKFGIKINPKYIPLYRAMLRHSQTQNQIHDAGNARQFPESPSQAA